MLFARTFDRPNLLSRIRRFRSNAISVYACALAAVAAATLTRLALHQELSTASPFTVYSLPLLGMSLMGGFWPGIATLLASLSIGSIFCLPPAFSLTLADGAEWPLLMFAVVGLANVIVVSGMIAAILHHDDHQQILLRELQHRSHNLFAFLHAVVSKTLSECATVDRAKEALESRLAALARTHAILVDGGWLGAALDHLIAEELASFKAQVSCAGCDLRLNASAAQSFSLIIHELATNAIKYGALSRPQGRVAIEGSIVSERGKPMFCFSWTETGGPAVSKPTREGFGTTILSRMSRRFAQKVEVTYDPRGLVYLLQVFEQDVQACDGRGAADTEDGADRRARPYPVPVLRL